MTSKKTVNQDFYTGLYLEQISVNACDQSYLILFNLSIRALLCKQIKYDNETRQSHASEIVIH